jgi:hypothetical protein
MSQSEHATPRPIILTPPVATRKEGEGPAPTPALTPAPTPQPVSQEDWITQQRREEYRVAPLVTPIVEGAAPSFQKAVGTVFDVITKPAFGPTPPGIKPRTSIVPVPEIGLAETLARIEVKPLINLPRLLGVPRTPEEGFKPRKETVRPFAGVAGEIAPAEAFVYTVGTLAGFKTPRIPPTLLSFGYGKAMEYGPEYAAGTVAGDILLSMGFGKVTGKIWEYAPEVVKAPIERVVSKVTSPVSERIESWLSGSYEEAAKAGELWHPSITERIVMGATGIKPQLSYGEVAFPIVETVSKTGVISGVPSGLPFTDIGWELSIAPRMGGVMITKEAVETSPKALELFFGIGEELFPFGKALAEGEPLGFEKPKAEPVTEKGLPSSMLEEGYYPKVGGFDVTLKEVNVRGVTSWTKWPTLSELMSEQKLLPFTTQTQVTRLGITPFIPDISTNLESASQFLGSAFMLGLGTTLLSKPSQQPKASERLTTFQVPSLKSLTELDSALMEKQTQVPALISSLVSMQVTKQIQTQIQIQVPKTSLKTPFTFDFPKDFSMPKMWMPKPGRRRKHGQGLYLWEFPILEPSKVLKKLMK